MKKLLFMCLLLASSLLNAKILSAVEAKPEQSIQENYFEKFKQSESLTRQALLLAIHQRDSRLIQHFLPLYQTFKQQDPILIGFSLAILAKERGDNTKAIQILSSMLARVPNLTAIRLELATLLFFDQQLRLAEKHFDFLKQQKPQSKALSKLIERYLNKIKEREGWNNDLNLSYVRTPNVNKVSSDRHIEGTAFTKNEPMLPQSAEGIAVNWLLGKEKNLVKNHYIAFQNQLFYQYYWNNKDNSYAVNRLSIGYKLKKMRWQWQLLPFYEQYWLGKHRYQ